MTPSDNQFDQCKHEDCQLEAVKIVAYKEIIISIVNVIGLLIRPIGSALGLAFGVGGIVVIHVLLALFVPDKNLVASVIDLIANMVLVFK